MLWRFLNIFKVMLTFFDFCIQTTIKTLSHLSEKGVTSNNFFFFFFGCLKYKIMFLTKLLVKKHNVPRFGIFLRFCLLFTIFSTQKPPKKSSQVLKKVRDQTNLRFLKKILFKFFCHIYESF